MALNLDSVPIGIADVTADQALDMADRPLESPHECVDGPRPDMGTRPLVPRFLFLDLPRDQVDQVPERPDGLPFDADRPSVTEPRRA